MRIVRPIQHRTLREALKYLLPHRMTLRENYDGTKRKRVHAWLFWNF